MHRSLFPQLARHILAALVVAFLCFGTGCAPEVGDSCETRTECPSGALCDTTAPGGYCTFEQCVRNGCTEESLCIFFEQDVSYCMKTCSDDSECRDGYVCRTDVGDIPFCYVAATNPG